METVRRNNMNLSQKINIISAVEQKLKSVKHLQEEFNCGKSQIYDIIKNKELLKEMWLQSGESGRRRRLHQPSKYDKINDLVYDWLVNFRTKKLPVSGPMIKASALQIAAGLGLHQFKASNGWLQSFRQRHSITFSENGLESNDIDTDAVNNWQKKLTELTQGFEFGDIANADKMTLYFRAIPDKTAENRASCSRLKQTKERLTVLVCAFADGSFMRPLVIGKSENPRCFKGVNIENLPITWRSNNKALMTHALMEEWLREFNDEMRQQNRNILLFLDNASSHLHLELSNIKLRFFPPKSTGVLQPLDQGVMKCIKVHYQKQFHQTLLAQMDNTTRVSELSAKVSIMDAIRWLHLAFCDVPTTFVRDRFRRAGFPVQIEDAEFNNTIDTLPLMLNDCIDDESCADLSDIDAVDVTNDDPLTLDDTVENTLRPECIIKLEDESVDEEVETSQCITTSDAIKCVETLKKYAEQTDNSDMLKSLCMIREHIWEAELKAINRQRHFEDVYKQN